MELTYELDTVCHSDLDGTLPNGYTAHPKVDPATGKLHAVAYHWALPHLQYIVIGADGLVEQGRPSTSPTDRWCTTARSPSGGWSSTTCP